MLFHLGLQGSSSPEDNHTSPLVQYASSPSPTPPPAPAGFPLVGYASSPSPPPREQAGFPLVGYASSPSPPPRAPTDVNIAPTAQPAPHTRSPDAPSHRATVARSNQESREERRQGKQTAESSQQRRNKPKLSKMQRVRQHLGLPKGNGNAHAAPASLSPPPDPEDEDFPSNIRSPSSDEVNLLSDDEHEAEQYHDGGSILMQLHFNEETAAMPSDDNDDEDYNPSPTNADTRERVPMTDVDILKAMTFGSSRYPHGETMLLLGIEGDVESIFKACGLTKIMGMVEPTYPDEAAEFLASLSYKVTKNPALKKRNAGGVFKFKVHGQPYEYTFRDLNTLFGFPRGHPIPPSFDHEELTRVWQLITGTDNTAKAKGNQIRNPAISYARRAISEVFFAKDRTGPVNLDEKRFLTTALKKIKGKFPNGDDIMGDQAKSGLAFQWLKHLVDFRKRVVRNYPYQNPKPIFIGGPITAVLRMCDVPLGDEPHKEPCFMDFQYLRSAHYLDQRELNGEPIYKFFRTGEEIAYIILPNLDLTTLDDYENIMFNHPTHLLANPADLQARPKRPRNRPTAAAANQRVTAIADSPPDQTPAPGQTSAGPESPDGSDYEEAPGTYDKYYAPRASPHIKKSHERTNLLQTPVKWVVKGFRPSPHDPRNTR